MASTQEVAKWMYEVFNKHPFLYQSIAVRDIKIHFGKEFLYINKNGNEAINTEVLKQFRKLTEGEAVWDRSSLCWRHLRKGEIYKGRREV